MNITRLNHLFCATALSSIVFLAVGCSEKKAMPDARATADKSAQSKSELPAATTPTTAASADMPMAMTPDKPGMAADGWAAIKDDTFAQRTHFVAGMKAMTSAMDGRIAAMTNMPGMTGDSGKGAMMTEVTAARTELKTASDKLEQATAATWTTDKDQVAKAWMRMQAACDKALGS